VEFKRLQERERESCESLCPVYGGSEDAGFILLACNKTTNWRSKIKCENLGLREWRVLFFKKIMNYNNGTFTEIIGEYLFVGNVKVKLELNGK
jgi:hypothetical protein